MFTPDFLIIPYPLILDKSVSPSERLVYAVVYWYEHLREGKCIASNNAIATLLGVDASSVQKCLLNLEARGYITRTFKDEERTLREEIRTLVSYKAINIKKEDAPLNSGGGPLNSGDIYNNIYIYKNIYKAYQEKICPTSRLTPGAKQKIRMRLKEYTEDELLQAIENFSKASWWMEHNSRRGVEWFFHSDKRIDQFLNLKVEKRAGVTIL